MKFLSAPVFTWFAFVLTMPVVAEDGRLLVRIVDDQRNLTAARAWVDVVETGERLFRPESPETVTPYARDRSFSCDGQFTMIAPAGKLQLHVEKGKEYVPQEISINLAAAQVQEQTVTLSRWIDMPSEGWYSADMHIHLGADDPRVLKQLSLADDVHLLPSFTYWLRGRGEKWNADWPDDSYTDPIVIDERHVVTRNNLEIERIDRSAQPGGTIGATFLFHLNRAVTAENYGEHFPTDGRLSLAARAHSPASVFDSDKPSWAETVVGAALGGLDTIQLCHNHYHRDATLLGGYGMIGPLSAGESNSAAGDGLFHRTNSLYYRFLNCGFRLGVSGGSAIGVMPVPAGFHRVYASIEGPLSADKMWRAIKDGKSFVTSGPMLSLHVDEHEIGDTIAFDSSSRQTLSITTSVRSIHSLEALQIVRDGIVVATGVLTGDAADPILEAELTMAWKPNKSGWIASRALFRAPDGLLRQAHTSPIYVKVDDQPTTSAEDARYMLRWIDQLRQIATSDPDRFPDRQVMQQVLEDYDQAAEVYRAQLR